MRKILFCAIVSLLFFAYVMATQQTLTQLTGNTFATTDTVIASGNFTVDSFVTIRAFWLPAGTNYTLSESGTGTGFLLDGDGVAWKDSSTGTKTYPDSIVLNGASAIFRTSSGSGAITSTNTILVLNGTTGMTLDNNKAMSPIRWRFGAGAKLATNTSSALLTATSGGTLYYAAGNTKININALYFSPTATCDLFSFGANDTMTGTISTVINIPNNVTITIPKVFYNGTAAAWRIPIVAGTRARVNFADSFNLGTTTDYEFRSENASVDTIAFMGAYSTCDVSKIGSEAAGVTVVLWGSATHVFTTYDGTNYNAGTTKDYLQSATFNIGGSWYNGTNHTIDPGTSTVNILNTSTVLTSMKKFYSFCVQRRHEGHHVRGPPILSKLHRHKW